MHNDDDSSLPEPPKPPEPPPRSAKPVRPDSTPLETLYPNLPPQDPDHPNIAWLDGGGAPYEKRSEGAPLTTDVEPMGPIVIVTPILSAADFARLDPFSDRDE